MTQLVGTAIPPAASATAPHVRPLPRTHLSLHRFAQMFSINPLHFAGGESSTLFRHFVNCDHPWPRHTFQAERQASWEDLAFSIRDAEQDIGRWLGYYVAPQWTLEEEFSYPKYRDRHFTNGINMMGQRPDICLQKGHIIAGGQRLATEIELDVNVTYSDEDGDGFAETATITATVPGAVTVSDTRTIGVFMVDQVADPRWEIRPLNSVSLSGSTLTIKAYSWQFVDPDVHGAFPTTGDYSPATFDDTSDLVGTVDVYMITNDATATGSRFMWKSRPLVNCSVCAGVGCDECSYTTQDGCLVISDGKAGLASPVPATYSSGWTSDELTIARSPDKVKVWFYSGYVGEDYKSGLSSDPLEEWLAQAIAWLAVARLDRQVCHCSNEIFKRLQEDMAHVSPQGNFLAISDEVQKAPFGTRRGEWLAYQKLKHAMKYFTVAIL